MSQLDACARCGGTGTTGERIRLWDDRPYCRECVERASAGLFEYAEANPALEECVETDTLAALHVPRWWALRFTWRTGLMFVMGVWFSQTDSRNLGLFAIGSALVFGVLDWLFLWHGRSLFWPDASSPMRIVAHGGVLECFRGDDLVASGPFDQWSWWHSDYDKRKLGPLVTLGAPKSSKDKFYVCGATPELRPLWVGFFKLIRLRRMSA
jgi:hypothetical protein